ncbi:MAG: FdhF/YdeP family oxidoreductase [Nitrospinaceae bacterium]|jgi:molybdopterin-dependent oxidoreductase alpha subunit|nr:FdhF/YdeP family oxidoreductase [Nitrospina sp.]MBT5376898.1 FdhF/YdeP family oxidoreductase [Nitrospinaceae bacterium]MBT5868439.1 FdhF/YdeP family oxidoreductase [Nitrospinaceae bacterium]
MTRKRPRTIGGWGAIRSSLKMAHRGGGLWPMLKALASRNNCKSCALGMGGQKGGMRDEKGHFPAVCNKSFMAQASDMQGILPAIFFDQHNIATLSKWASRDLEFSGRLTQPVLNEAGATHYRPISWDEAIDRVVKQLRATSADRSYFYASGRSSNEAGFLLQLFARIYGTNNINNCSYFCHQASGVGLTQSLGTSTATVELEDLDHADLVFLMGANPASNHPRFMRILMDVRRRGGQVIVINPAKERGLENFSVPSDVRSLLFGSEIASLYLQPHIGGDIALLKGIAKSLLSNSNSHSIDRSFIENHTQNFSAVEEDIQTESWEDLEHASGITRADIEKTARLYSKSKNTVFAWSMGITHHRFGVDNVQAIVNLALMRGMVGKQHAGLLPLRGHSNVQGIGSIGFTPQLKKEILDNLESQFPVTLPTKPGLDTLACIEAANAGDIDFAYHLGGNLYGSSPDSKFAQKALAKVGFSLFLNTTLNPGHFLGRGQTSLILPVCARDEEPEPTTQESMFNYIRLSDGGLHRYSGPRSEVKIIAEIAQRVLPENSPLAWKSLHKTGNIREMIAAIVPGFNPLQNIAQTGKEFQIAGRILHKPEFPSSNGKASFKVCPVPAVIRDTENSFILMTIRSEGQFNSVVYEPDDRYRGVKGRNVVLMSMQDIKRLGLKEGQRVTVKNDTGRMTSQKLLAYPIKPGNIMMYYPESNVLVPRQFDPQSKTPSFKSIKITIEN